MGSRKRHIADYIAAECITVAQLIEHLRGMDQSLPVGRVGHFGEFHPIRLFNIREYHATIEGGMLRAGKDIAVVAIEPPYIGPEPD